MTASRFARLGSRCPRGHLAGLLVSTVTAVTFAGSAARAQEKRGEVDEVFKWATPDAPGCVCAVSRRGTLLVNSAYGAADLERDVPLGTESRFDVGSVRKQFIAAAILMLAEEGKLSLDDDARRHILELPDYGHTVTIDHLLTHTSGLRDWTGLQMLAGGNIDVLALILRQRSLNFVPGEEWAYSNSGYVLLKEIVVRVSGTPFPEFARSRMFEPLGMTMTAYHEDLQDVIEHRALAYARKGGVWKHDMRVGHERGSGGALFSTARDMVTWNDALTGGRMGRFVTTKLEETATLNNGRKLQYARGVIVDSTEGARAVVHTGGAGGYSTWSGRLPEHGLSIAVLCNADEMGTSALANRLADLFLPAEVLEAMDRADAGAAPEGVAVTEANLKARAGLFLNESTGEPLRLGVQGGRLRVIGGPPLVSVAEDRFRNPRGSLFFRSQDEFELRFVSEHQLEITSMEGLTTRYRRAQPPPFSTDDLLAFAGRYGSDEVGAVIEIVPGNGGVVMRFELSPDKALSLRPADRDTFQAGMMLIRFRRDAEGGVVGFDYSNPLIRKLPFSRVNAPR